MPVSTPTVSVCLPLFNGERYLENAVRSVQTQTFSDFELVVIDDCSSDSSPELMASLAASDSRIRFYRNESRLGLFANYNECMRRARGKFIKPFAQDDLLFPSCLDSLLCLFEANPGLALASGARNFIDEQGRKLADDVSTPSACHFLQPGIPQTRQQVLSFSADPIHNIIGEPSAVLFPRALIGDGFNPDFPHLGDLEFWLRLLHYGDFACTSEVICLFRHHGQSQSRRNLKDLIVATDHLALSGRLSGLPGRTDKEFQALVNDEMISVGIHINQMVRKEHLTLPSNGNSKEDRLNELALRALYLLGDLALKRRQPRTGADRKIYYNERRIKRLEHHLQKLLADPGWRLTRPLRELKRSLNIASPSTVMPAGEREVSSTKARIIDTQSTYISTIHKAIESIKQSSSWRLREQVLSASTLLKRDRDNSQLLSLVSRLPRLDNTYQKNPAVSSIPPDKLITKRLYERIYAEIPAVSIVVSVENESVFSTMLGLNHQSASHSTFEVIAIDAFSSEQFGPDISRLSAMPSLDLQLRAFRIVSGGRSTAHNVALKFARAPIVIFLAGDFAPNADFVSSHLRFHQEHKESNIIGIGSGQFPDELLDIDFRRWLNNSPSLFGISTADEPLEVPPHFFYVANSSLKRELLDRAGFFDEDFPYDAWDDYELGLRLNAIGSHSMFVPGAGCKHIHSVTFKSRCESLRIAGESACIFDCKHGGFKPWHDDLARSAWQHRADAAIALARFSISGDTDLQERYWLKTLKAYFVEGYLSKLRELDLF